MPTLEESNKAARREAEDGARAAGAAPREREPAPAATRSIDPPGFALEHFNSVGQWRETDADGAPIDSAGVAGGRHEGRRSRRAARGDPQAARRVRDRASPTRLLTYALGRGLEPSDMPVVRQIVKKAARDDYRFASIISGIVDSPLFQMRTRLGARPNRPTRSHQAKEQ